jgi:hypothetical protein
VHPTEATEQALRSAGEPGFRARHVHLVDLSPQCDLDFDFSSMMHMVYRLEPFYARCHAEARMALYAPRDLAFGVSRMYQSLTSDRAGPEVGVFRRRLEALSFLGLSETAVAELWPPTRVDCTIKAAGPSWP